MHFGVVLIESVSPVNELLMDNLSDPVWRHLERC
jgi:hypothetical protein